MKTLCVSCRTPNHLLNCELCSEPVCKNCVQRLKEDAFLYQTTRAPELSHTLYCAFCFDAKVAPQLESYEETLSRARAVYFFFTTQKKQYPLIRRSKQKLVVEACADRDETILRLGFKAAELGFNAVIEGDVSAKKIRNGGYQHSVWQGTGLPAQVDAEKLSKQEYYS